LSALDHRTTGKHSDISAAEDGRTPQASKDLARAAASNSAIQQSKGLRCGLFDPKSETGTLLERMGIKGQRVEVTSDLSAYDVLIVGKGALSVGGPAPDISRVRDGLKVLIFEQTPDVLEKRFGFRVEEYGLRQVFPRVPDHPALNGLNVTNLSDWRGEATILPPRLKYEMRPRYGTSVEWCGLPVTRLWRCGNRGNVASVLIEKPARGHFLPIVDGGYSLQYSPLLEYREGKGLVLFCQLDVTGRTEAEPAADILARNLLSYVSAWKPPPAWKVVYVGEQAGRNYLQSAGVPLEAYDGTKLSPEQVLVAGPGAGEKLAPQAGLIADWLKAGGHLLAIGLEQTDLDAFLPFKVSVKRGEHIAAFFEPFSVGSLLAAVAPADVHNRDPRELPLISGGVKIFGDGVLAQAENMNVVFCQLAPWQFDNPKQMNLKRTYRRASFLIARLLANMGVAAPTPLLDRFHSPVTDLKSEQRWLTGFYNDQPEEWDDPYRFFRW
jgi:hypothetical protein